MEVLRAYDVLVLGGGNAALCAALTARSAGKSVLVLECAPKHFRGGNSRHTRNLRCMHDAPTDVLTDAYPEEEYWQDLLKVTGGQTNQCLAGQPDQIGYAIIDVKAIGKFMPPVFPPIKAASIGELAVALGLDPEALQAAVTRFNQSVRPGTFNHTILDDCVTDGLAPPKTHWARAIDALPFFAYPLRPGITFTYLGVAVDERAQMIMQNGSPSDNIFAAGEIMAGNVLGKGYIAGIGMSIGTAFGRIAGEEAARRVDA